MKMTLMGTGTSFGVPVPGCNCKVCTSQRPKEWRNRCSAYVTGPADVVIDTGPEFRIQALKYNVSHIDAVLITHSHADHLHGLDDLRIFSHTKAVDPSNPQNKETEGEGMPIYANSNTIRDITYRFAYIFMPVKEGGGKPKLKLEDNESYNSGNPLKIKNLEVVPVPIFHGSLKDSGYILSETSGGKKNSIAYLTDCNSIPESSYQLIKEAAPDIEHLVIDGLRIKKHSTHFSFDEALEAANRIKAKHTWFTHLTHDYFSEEIQQYIDEHLKYYPELSRIVKEGGSVSPAFDGLELKA